MGTALARENSSLAAPPSEVLGRYRVRRPLGSGGSGSVWLAQDARSGSQVALKVVPLEGRAGARAEREAAAARRLDHPRCPRLLDLQRDDDHVYVVYEYIPGRTVREALRAGQLDERAALETVSQLLEALAHAHARRIVHRDVKPANTLLADGQGIDVRLLDFGLVSFEETEGLTATGDVPGTLAYVAPERLRGERGGSAADVWAAGLILWEALAGRQPFWSSSPIETARRIESGVPALELERPGLPRELTRLVARMVDPDPSRRPSAKRACAELRAQLDGRAPSQPRSRRSRQTISDLKGRVAAACLTGVFAGFASTLLPFYPAGFGLAAGLVSALLFLRTPVGALGLALLTPLLPLGNVALGLALAYLALAALWLLAFARRPGLAFAFLAGPVLIPLGLAGLVPCVLERAGGALVRATSAACGVFAAALFAALAGSTIPLAGGKSESLGLGGSESPLQVAAVVGSFLGRHEGLLLLAAVLAAASAASPWARRGGPWAVGAWGCTTVAFLLLGPPLASGLHAEAGQLLPGLILATAWLAVPRRSWRAVHSRLRDRAPAVGTYEPSA